MGLVNAKRRVLFDLLEDRLAHFTGDQVVDLYQMIADVDKVLVVVKADRTLNKLPAVVIVVLAGRGDHIGAGRVVVAADLTLRHAADGVA